ncbi:dihydrolipoamide acetyltransferase family protein [Pseudogracilibacillus auburnensis]|uniref:Dihydrolipoamide acetyltransferase component of pyruvate dehydrogenase complex n=1 Tax=Pseudogracilibacillus auburnensis TaxID=1494959 RepID=A0A2V3WDE2_9BACI|nr:dihydrolipoamide acetyltransferase family protein [Pseudogracilibacillus auburnensis]PXW90215.1 pyruvate dehydrogenase E2 component (dihydrolipoamide acetyltransferase) [Pseudogracilibacillus auburnensis]
MAKEIFMPKLSSTMEVGTLLQWLKEEGDPVQVGDPLFEIMTDKINIEVESYEEGVLLKKYYEVDDEVPINTIIGYIGEAGETVPDEPPASEGEEVQEEVDSPKAEKTTMEQEQEELEEVEGQVGKVRATPAARRVARENDLSLETISGSGPKGRIHEQDVLDAVKENAVLITPLAEKMAKDHQLDVRKIEGTGIRGKIEKSDVERYLSSQKVREEEPAERVKLKGLRKAVADKMLESARSIPHVTLTTEVDMTKVIDIRKNLLPIVENETGYRLSFTEIIIKSTAHTLTKHRNINASLIDNEIVYNKAVNIGLAVAVDNGLIVPSIHDADKKGLAELTAVSKTLGKKARDSKLTPAEMTGSTFTISNLGMYAIDGFTPIINPPETAILGVGRITEKPVVVDGNITVRPMMVLSLSFDHRAIDGAPAAAFLTELKETLENPYSLFV